MPLSQMASEKALQLMLGYTKFILLLKLHWMIHCRFILMRHHINGRFARPFFSVLLSMKCDIPSVIAWCVYKALRMRWTRVTCVFGLCYPQQIQRKCIRISILRHQYPDFCHWPKLSSQRQSTGTGTRQYYTKNHLYNSFKVRHMIYVHLLISALIWSNFVCTCACVCVCVLSNWTIENANTRTISKYLISDIHIPSLFINQLRGILDTDEQKANNSAG